MPASGSAPSKVFEPHDRGPGARLGGGQPGTAGPRAGAEIVQLYLHDVEAPVTRPLLQLAGFARVPLAAGETATVEFTLDADRTTFIGPDLRRVVAPGEIQLSVGRSAADLPCRASFRLTGTMRAAGADRVLTTPVVVRRG